MDSDDSFSDSLIDKSNDLINLKPLNLTNFKKIKRIINDSFSTIYSIEEKASGQIYLAKFLDMASMRLFFNEIEILDMISKLHSSLFIKSIGYSLKDFYNESIPSIIFEYVPNGSLQHLLDTEKKALQPIEWDNTKKLIVIYGIACGMKILHSNKIIHRDLKPGNILLDEYLLPKISFFTLSITEDELLKKSLYDQLGTFAYMAPEIIEGKKYGKSIDVYSFSMIVYEIMSGRNPYNTLLNGKMNQYELSNKIIEGYRPAIDIYDIYSQTI